MKFIPVARGIINEKLLVDRALNKASAENMINAKAVIKGMFNTRENQSLILVSVLPFSCILISAAPVTLKAA